MLPSHEYLSREGPLRAVPRYQNVEVKFFFNLIFILAVPRAQGRKRSQGGELRIRNGEVRSAGADTGAASAPALRCTCALRSTLEDPVASWCGACWGQLALALAPRAVGVESGQRCPAPVRDPVASRGFAQDVAGVPSGLMLACRGASEGRVGGPVRLAARARWSRLVQGRRVAPRGPPAPSAVWSAFPRARPGAFPVLSPGPGLASIRASRAVARGVRGKGQKIPG